MIRASDISSCGREEWTSSPEAAAKYVTQNIDSSDRQSILYVWSIMSQGGVGDPIEPWGPSIRSVVYPNWSDTDFARAIELVRDSGI